MKNKNVKKLRRQKKKQLKKKEKMEEERAAQKAKELEDVKEDVEEPEEEVEVIEEKVGQEPEPELDTRTLVYPEEKLMKIYKKNLMMLMMDGK